MTLKHAGEKNGADKKKQKAKKLLISWHKYCNKWNKIYYLPKKENRWQIVFLNKIKWKFKKHKNRREKYTQQVVRE